MLLPTARLLAGILPAPLTLWLIRALSGRSQRPTVTPAQQQAMSSAQRLHYGAGNRNTAWSWGMGPLVILVHGWGGRAAQLAPLAQDVARMGFRCVAIEVTGHGDSPGSRTAWSCFFEDLPALARSLDEPVHAWVGHSAGALTMMAARAAGKLQGGRYAAICAPSYPFPPVEGVRQRLAPSDAALERYRRFLAQELGTRWDSLQAGGPWRGTREPMLLFYDSMDRFVPHTEGDRILAFCPGAQHIKTHSYSHTKVLTAPELLEALGEFLQ